MFLAVEVVSDDESESEESEELFDELSDNLVSLVCVLSGRGTVEFIIGFTGIVSLSESSERLIFSSVFG